MSDSTHRCGWVALMGPPNAGKSTFLNSVLGQKVSIVTAKPQTTRNQIVGILTEKDAQVIFMDTPGVHHQRGRLNKVMHQAAWQSMSAADVVVLVLDCDLYVRKPDFLENDISSFKEVLAAETRPVFIVLNKVDLFSDKSRMLPLLEILHDWLPKAELLPVSSLRRDGLLDVVGMLKKHLPIAEAQFPEDQLSTLPVRFMAAEIIREKLFERLHQEIPYTLAVDIESWEEHPETKQIVIHAVIYVGRPQHKGMVIGKGGTVLKSVGTEARKEIQILLDQKVHLELWVKVLEGWTEDPAFLHELGMGME